MLKNHKKLSEGEKWRMKKVYIWGTGKYGRKVLPAVRTEYCSIEGFIDNDPSKYGKVYSGIEIVPFREIMDGREDKASESVDCQSRTRRAPGQN